MEQKSLELPKDPGKAHFQEELNRWFESRGIISDLRSHLRHLMITALQNTQIGLKPTDKTSPKAQALNLIVAEYLFRHGCHYTLSVFTSEVPTLANFSANNPGLILRGEKSSEGIKNHLQRHYFQEKELEEICNALGITSFEDLERLRVRYVQKGCDSSLVEVFFQVFTEISTKLHIGKILESHAVDEDRKFLSEKWSSKVTDILLNEKMKSAQIAAVNQAILRVTENEMKRIIEEEHKMQMRILAEREKRIQEHLRRHEEEVFSQLVNAEKEFNERKKIIEDELTDRQKHLAEMALEWNKKHEEILKLSKDFHNIESENMRLQKRVGELETERGNFKIERETQKKTTEELRIRISSLSKKLKEATDSNAILHEQIEILMKREDEDVSNAENAGNGEEVTTNSPGQKWNVTGMMKGHIGAGDTSHRPNINLSDNENDSSSASICCDEIISSFRKKLKVLEEESNRINRNYMDYKFKSQNVYSDSDPLPVDGSVESQENMPSPKLHPEIIIKETKFCQTVSPDAEEENILRLKEEKGQGQSGDRHQNPREKSPVISFKKPEIRTPTKRQQQNREFFLESRQLLKEFEKQRIELNADTLSFIESSLENVASTSLDESDNSEERVKDSPKETALPTPVRGVSFYCSQEADVGKEVPGEITRRKVLNQLTQDDKSSLLLLEKTRIKSPKEPGIKLLRQQILMLESDAAHSRKQKSKGDENNKSPNSLISTPNCINSGNVSAGRKSGSDGVR